MGDAGATGPSYIMTLDQLVEYHDTTKESEDADKVTLSPLVNPGTGDVQAKLMQWASVGFPHEYGVLSMPLIRPMPCTDGITRDVFSYIFFLTGKELLNLTLAYQACFQGMTFSYTINGNVVGLNVTKAPTA
jgi:hypothetical protein